MCVRRCGRPRDRAVPRHAMTGQTTQASDRGAGPNSSTLGRRRHPGDRAGPSGRGTPARLGGPRKLSTGPASGPAPLNRLGAVWGSARGRSPVWGASAVRSVMGMSKIGSPPPGVSTAATSAPPSARRRARRPGCGWPTPCRRNPPFTGTACTCPPRWTAARTRWCRRAIAGPQSGRSRSRPRPSGTTRTRSVRPDARPARPCGPVPPGRHGDTEWAALPLPRTYGVDDIPVIVQDVTFDGPSPASTPSASTTAARSGTRVLRSYLLDAGPDFWNQRFGGGDDSFDAMQLRAAPTLRPSRELPGALPAWSAVRSTDPRGEPPRTTGDYG